MKNIIAYASLTVTSIVLLYLVSQIWIHDVFYIYEDSMAIRVTETILLLALTCFGLVGLISLLRR